MPTRPIPSQMRSIALVLTLGAALSGCVSFGSKPPPQLLTVSAEAAMAADRTLSSQGLPAIAVILPDVPRAIATTRVPVQVNATSIAYVKDAQWTEAPRDLFLRLLDETITAGGALFVIDGDQYGISPQRRLSGSLIEFGLDARTKEAVVTYDAVLTDSASGQAARRRFTAREPVSDIRADRVAQPINRAANIVAQQVADWVKG